MSLFFASLLLKFCPEFASRASVIRFWGSFPKLPPTIEKQPETTSSILNGRCMWLHLLQQFVLAVHSHPPDVTSLSPVMGQNFFPKVFELCTWSFTYLKHDQIGNLTPDDSPRKETYNIIYFKCSRNASELLWFGSNLVKMLGFYEGKEI